MRELDFGDIGVKIGDEIVFTKTSQKFIVASGKGIPSNGGTLVGYPDENREYYSLQYMTRRLMQNDFDERLDIWNLWAFEGKTLRSIYTKRSWCRSNPRQQ